LTFGASPRATIALIEGARALAFLRGRPYALPQDLIDLVPDVLRHRLVLSYEALSEGMTADGLILKIFGKTKIYSKNFCRLKEKEKSILWIQMKIIFLHNYLKNLQFIEVITKEKTKKVFHIPLIKT
jgi:hypothetical protein